MLIWMKQQMGEGGWTAMPIAPNGRTPHCFLLEAGADGAPLGRLALFEKNGVQHAALLLARERRETVLVNGFPALPVTVLEDCDEIVVRGERLLFGAFGEQAPRVLAAEEQGGHCSRCHLELRAGDEVRACPGCNALAHEGRLAAAEGAPASAPRTSRLCASHDDCCGSCQRDVQALCWHPDDLEVCE